MKIDVSIIIPAYNAEQFIGRCLDSIINQELEDIKIEIIIINDGSSDNTDSICEEYANQNSVVRYYYQENGGVSKARNKGLDLATGEVILFIDCDDSIKPGYIKELLKWREYDFVTAGFHWQDQELEWHVREFSDEDISIKNLKETPSNYLGKYYFGAPWAKLYKRELIEENALRFNTNVHSGEDSLFIFDYLKSVQSIKIVPLCGYTYYFYENSLAHKIHSEYWKWKIAVEHSMETFFTPLNEDESNYLYNRFFEVLQDLLNKYSSMWNEKELFELYKNPFFKKSISLKRRSGKLGERCLIFCMDYKKYNIYLFITKIEKFLKRCSRWVQRHCKKG